MSGNSQAAALKTRQRLLESFNSLVLRGEQGRITVADVVREADVGRSTFYDHYLSADDIHEQALAAPMTLLAESILGLRSEEDLSALLEHFHDHRTRARETLSGRDGEKVEKLLGSILESRLSKRESPDRQARKVASIELAAIPLALIRAWLGGSVRGTSSELAGHLLKAGEAMRKVLF